MERSTPEVGTANTRSLGRRQLLRAGAGALAALGAARAFADEPAPDPALIAAARQEGTLTIYTPSEIGMMVNWCASFTQAYGVQVKAVRGPGYPMFDRWLNEERVGRHFADIMQSSDPTLLDSAFKLGFLANYKPAADAAVFPTMKRSGVWYALRAGYMGIAYNTTRVSADDEHFIQTHGWDTLADPRWNGRCATAAAASGGSTYAYTYMFLTGLKDRYGEPFLRKWAANKPEIYISKPPLFDRLAAGQYAIADMATQADVESLYLKGAPVRWVYPDPTPTILTSQGVSAHAPHPNAARLFAEWALSVPGQTAWLQYESSAPSRPDVVDPRKTGKQAWFKEPWYAEPKTLYLSYLTEPAFADPAKPLIPIWNGIFGYGDASQ
jgi:ABC-type Fe3+ transport system substrate-binding protein